MIDEIAAIFLISFLRIDITMHKNTENQAIIIIIGLVFFNVSSKGSKFFIRPDIPSLSMIPAKIIEPIVEASTWALGSQTCKKNRGIFTRIIIIIIKDNIISIDFFCSMVVISIIIVKHSLFSFNM